MQTNTKKYKNKRQAKAGRKRNQIGHLGINRRPCHEPEASKATNGDNLLDNLSTTEYCIGGSPLFGMVLFNGGRCASVQVEFLISQYPSRK